MEGWCLFKITFFKFVIFILFSNLLLVTRKCIGSSSSLPARSWMLLHSDVASSDLCSLAYKMKIAYYFSFFMFKTALYVGSNFKCKHIYSVLHFILNNMTLPIWQGTDLLLLLFFLFYFLLFQSKRGNHEAFYRIMKNSPEDPSHLWPCMSHFGAPENKLQD